MKKLLSIVLAFAMLFSVSAANAQYFPALFALQQFIEKYSPSQIIAMGSHEVEITGTILEIHSCNQGNHYEMTLEVDDPKAMTPVGYEKPIISVHFRLHVEQIPFSVGQEIDIRGSLNAMYSSVMIPNILADTIDGSDDF